MGRLSALDFHPSLGHSGHGASTVLPSPRELPPRFLPGQESSSVLQLSKRPKPRAKDVAHRKSLASTIPVQFHDMDTSFGIPSSSGQPNPHLLLHPFLTTETVGVSEERGSLAPERSASRLEHSPPIIGFEGRFSREGGLGLAWRPTGPGVADTTSTPSPVDVVLGGGNGSRFGAGASLTPGFGPFSVLLIFEDGRSINQPTWPTVNVLLLRRQVSMTLQCSPDIFTFVCYGAVLD